MGEIAINPKHNVHKKYRKMNLVNPYIFAPPVVVPVANTFIGGVASTLYSAALLAAKLAIDVSRISAFEVAGSDIKCKITGGYPLLGQIFDGMTSLTYLIDNDGLINAIGGGTFRNTSLSLLKADGIIMESGGGSTFSGCPLKIWNAPNLKNLTTDNSSAFANSSITTLYIPKCETIGTTTGSDSVSLFFGLPSSAIIYTNPLLQTINAGGLEGDLVGIPQTVRFVTSLTAPNQVTTLAVGIVYSTAIQLNFTPPSSTNTIDFYECYVNGVFLKILTASGQYITGLLANTAYQLTVIAVDSFYNKSIVSNSVSVSTNNTSAVPLTGLVSYYKLETNSIDSFGTNNGVNTAVTYGVGKIGNSAVFNGTTSKTIIGNPTNFQLSQGTVMCWVKASASGSSYRSIFGKTLAYNIFLVDGFLMVYNWGSFGGAGNRSSGVNLNDGLWHHVVFVFESNTALNYLYIDGILKLTFSWAVLNQTDNVCIGSSNSTQYINASIDEASIYNVKLTQSQIQLIYNNGNGITL